MKTKREIIFDEIKEYCKYNDITDVDGFIDKILEDGFTAFKYGIKPKIKKKNTPLGEEPILEKKEQIVITETIKDEKEYDIYGEEY
jgi:hypothetical protein